MTIPALTQFGGRIHSQSFDAKSVVGAAQARADAVAKSNVTTANGFIDSAQLILNDLEITTSTVENSSIYRQIFPEHQRDVSNQLRAIRSFMENTKRKAFENKDLIAQAAQTEFRKYIIADIKSDFSEVHRILRYLERLCPGPQPVH